MKPVTIWKYPLSVVDVQTVNMPTGATILSVREQDGKPCLWVMVDPELHIETRTIRIFGTGHPIRTDLRLKFLGTVQVGALVWHVFDEETR